MDYHQNTPIQDQNSDSNNLEFSKLWETYYLEIWAFIKPIWQNSYRPMMKGFSLKG
jgi:hypothetical protein